MTHQYIILEMSDKVKTGGKTYQTAVFVFKELQLLSKILKKKRELTIIGQGALTHPVLPHLFFSGLKIEKDHAGIFYLFGFSLFQLSMCLAHIRSQQSISLLFGLFSMLRL